MANIRILSREDVIRVMEMQPVIDCVEEVYRQKSDGQTVVWPTTFYEFDPGHADMDIKSGYLPQAKLYGHKTVSWFEGNRDRGLPELTGLIAVYSAETGLPIGILDASYITGIRTGAAGRHRGQVPGPGGLPEPCAGGLRRPGPLSDRGHEDPLPGAAEDHRGECADAGPRRPLHRGAAPNAGGPVRAWTSRASRWPRPGIWRPRSPTRTSW